MTSTNTDDTRKRKLFSAALIVAAVAIVTIAIVVLLHPGEERTNDAQIEGHIHPINARVSGTVVWVNPAVEDTLYVPAGTILGRLDPNDYQPTVDRLTGETEASAGLERAAALNVPITQASALSRLHFAEAAVQDSEAELRAADAQRDAARTSVEQAAASSKRAEDDRVRYEALVTTHEISRSEYDQRSTEARTTQAALAGARASLVAAEERIESARLKIVERQQELKSAQTAPEAIASAKASLQRSSGDLKKARAALQDAQLNLGYTQLLAPIGGRIGRKSMEVGQRITAGQLMMTLVDPKDVWVVANFRETQLSHIRVGQTATIHIDSSGENINGRVDSIGGATGSKNSLIAPDNATGNFVKVVQRVPVRIQLNRVPSGASPLLPGLSIEVTVRTK
jgi:membrane fusion protein (multidrug efflux system)